MDFLTAWFYILIVVWACIFISLTVEHFIVRGFNLRGLWDIESTSIMIVGTIVFSCVIAIIVVLFHATFIAARGVSLYIL